MTDTIHPADAARDEKIAALRALADWLETHPAAKAAVYNGRILHATWTRGELLAAAKAIGGTWIKRTDENYVRLVQQIAPGYEYDLYVERGEVCERVQTGTRTTVTPDAEQLAKVDMVTVTEPVYEWVCPPSLHEVLDREAG